MKVALNDATLISMVKVELEKIYFLAMCTSINNIFFTNNLTVFGSRIPGLLQMARHLG